MLKVGCWDGLNMIWHDHLTRYNMLESSKMSYNIFELVQKCWTVFPTLLMIFSMFERFKQTFNMLYNVLSYFRTFGRSKMRHWVRFVKNINSFYTECLFMMAAKISNKKWQDGKIEKLIDLYEENPCLWDIFDNSYQKRDVKETTLERYNGGTWRCLHRQKPYKDKPWILHYKTLVQGPT